MNSGITQYVLIAINTLAIWYQGSKLESLDRQMKWFRKGHRS